MKADFEKGTKVCSRCKKELPIEMFTKNKNCIDGMNCYCKYCSSKKRKKYYKENKSKIKMRYKKQRKEYFDKTVNTFGGTSGEIKRGRSNILKRDYELTKEELERRKRSRERRKQKHKRTNGKGILIWYDEKLNELDYKTYYKIYNREYMNQRNCAIRGYIGKKKPSEHFLFDFDLEQMLKDNIYCLVNNGKHKKYITKWWDGEIRHWTVNDGIWKK